MKSNPKTTIWMNSPEGPIFVSEHKGLPNPLPKLHHPYTWYGVNYICRSIELSGKEITEVQLIVSD